MQRSRVAAQSDQWLSVALENPCRAACQHLTGAGGRDMVWEGPGRASVAGASRDSPISRDRRAGGEVVSGFAALAQATAFSAGKGRPGSQRFKAARWAEQARRRPVRRAGSSWPERRGESWLGNPSSSVLGGGDPHPDHVHRLPCLDVARLEGVRVVQLLAEADEHLHTSGREWRVGSGEIAKAQHV